MHDLLIMKIGINKIVGKKTTEKHVTTEFNPIRQT